MKYFTPITTRKRHCHWSENMRNPRTILQEVHNLVSLFRPQGWGGGECAHSKVIGVLYIPFRGKNCGIIPLRVLTCTMMAVRAVMGTFWVFRVSSQKWIELFIIHLNWFLLPCSRVKIKLSDAHITRFFYLFGEFWKFSSKQPHYCYRGKLCPLGNEDLAVP